mmetsp:Transcript_109517/g.186119  ORF Transcript_109517/g.186119 Transcript_109517/m.186119 type:complete len:96 (-) Transcript_109517:1382-1669(-)
MVTMYPCCKPNTCSYLVHTWAPKAQENSFFYGSGCCAWNGGGAGMTASATPIIEERCLRVQSTPMFHQFGSNRQGPDFVWMIIWVIERDTGWGKS